MRIIDRVLGVPLCFAMTWALRVGGWLRGRRSPAHHRKILFIELSEMGSVVLADPALRWTRRQGAQLYFAIFERNRASLSLLKTIPEEHVFTLRDGSLIEFAIDVIKFMTWTRAQGVDAVVDLELFSRATALLATLSGASARVGFHRYHNEGLYRGDLFTRNVVYNPHMHIAKNFLALVKSLFAETVSAPLFKGEIADAEIALPRAQPSPDSLARVEAALAIAPSPSQSWILLNCRGGDFLPQRRWPAEHYAQLAKRILTHQSDCRILLTGSRDEHAPLEAIRELIADDRCVNFAGAVSFEDLPALYSRALCMVTNDSGPAHFASVTSLPTFVFFGPETPSLYGALGPQFTAIHRPFACSPCVSAFNHRKTSCSDNQCLKTISPDDVYEILRQKVFSPRTVATP